MWIKTLHPMDRQPQMTMVCGCLSELLEALKRAYPGALLYPTEMHPAGGRSIFPDSAHDFQEVVLADCLLVVLANFVVTVDMCGLPRRDRRDWDNTCNPASAPCALPMLESRYGQMLIYPTAVIATWHLAPATLMQAGGLKFVGFVVESLQAEQLKGHHT